MFIIGVRKKFTMRITSDEETIAIEANGIEVNADPILPLSRQSFPFQRVPGPATCYPRMAKSF
jgi:hypothetical protein